MIIVDTSVAFKWFNEERDFAKALELLNSHLNQKEVIFVPELIIYELANSWATKSHLDLSQIHNNLKIVSVDLI